MIIFAGMNIFADGQNIVKRGAIFDKHKSGRLSIMYRAKDCSL